MKKIKMMLIGGLALLIMVFVFGSLLYPDLARSIGTKKYEPYVGEQVYGKYNKVIASRKDCFGFLTLNNAKEGNIYDMDMMKEIVSAAKEMDADDKVIIIIMNAAGKDFSLGIDYRTIPTNPEGAARFFGDFAANAAGLATLSKPVITAVHGRAYAGGSALALGTTDLAVLSEDARVGKSAITLGLTCAAGFKNEAAVVGPLKAKEYILTGLDIDPHELLRFGFANRVVPLEKLNEETLKLAKVIASRSWPMIKASKKTFVETANMAPGQAWKYGLEKLVAPLVATEDFKLAIETVWTEKFWKGDTTPVVKWKNR